MSITYNIEIYYKNIIERIKKWFWNSGWRKLWLKGLIYISFKYNIIIKLFIIQHITTKVEKLLTKIQLYWNQVILDTLDNMIDCLEKITFIFEKSLNYDFFTLFSVILLFGEIYLRQLYYLLFVQDVFLYHYNNLLLN